MGDSVVDVLSSIRVLLLSLLPESSIPTQASFVPSAGVVFPDLPDLVERAGYRSIEQQVREIIDAGGRLQDWRSAQYPEPDLSRPIPVFLDVLDAHDRFRVLQAEREERRAAAVAAAAEAAGAAVPVPVPEPVKPAPATSEAR
ncbi:MAG: hypothetical protein [Microvirus sp.]|nr:MAG: hypothetical protein [Microvirus sp.]